MKTYPIWNDIIDSSAHVLIAGTTGSGKSTLLNSLIFSLAYRDCTFVLIDPKRVELSRFRALENYVHYACEVPDIINLLDRVILTIGNRYRDMERMGLRKSNEPFLYVIIDEVADLMLSDRKKEIERKLQRIAQIGRASNVKLIVASQVIRADILTPKITANLDCRIALRCANSLESRLILNNQKGAEDLPKYGKCIVSDAEGTRVLSVPLTPDEEINAICCYKPKEGKITLWSYLHSIFTDLKAEIKALR